MKTQPIKSRGFTLMELMIAIAVLAILLSIGVASYSGLFKRNELRGASESLYSLITYAKSESIKSNQKIAVTITAGANGAWCAGIVTGATPCNCTVADSAANSCKVMPGERIVKIKGSEFKKISLDSDQTLVFDSVRGMPDTSVHTFGDIELSTDEGDKVKLSINAMGTVKTCTSGGSSDYAACI